MVGNFAADNGKSPQAVGMLAVFRPTIPHSTNERAAMTFTQRMKQYAALPEQMESAVRGIAVLVTIVGLIAVLALGLSVVALERTYHAD